MRTGKRRARGTDGSSAVATDFDGTYWSRKNHVLVPHPEISTMGFGDQPLPVLRKLQQFCEGAHSIDSRHHAERCLPMEWTMNSTGVLLPVGFTGMHAYSLRFDYKEDMFWLLCCTDISTLRTQFCTKDTSVRTAQAQHSLCVNGVSPKLLCRS